MFFITPVNGGMGDVVLSFEAEANNSTGLTWADGYLWNIGHGHDIPAELLKLDPSDGSELNKIYLPIQHVMGLTWDGTAFWAVSHQTSWIYKLDPITGGILHSFQSPNPGTVETGCEGMAWDGAYLWYADSEFDRIYKLDPTDGTQIDSFNSPGSKPQGLAYDGVSLWHYDLNTDLIYEINPADGSVITSFSAPGNGQGDLAWDGTYLWLCLNWDDMIHKIDVSNANPVAVAGNDQGVSEGEIVNFDGSLSYDPDGTIVSHTWDFDTTVDSDGDGNFINDVDATGSNPLHTYGDNGIYVVTLEVRDNYGYSNMDSCTITVNNVAPQIDSFGPFTVDEGVGFFINGSANDPGSDDMTFSWDWGDVTSENKTIYYNDGIGNDPNPSPHGNFPFSNTNFVWHIYEEPGTYLLNLTVSDDDGGSTVFSTGVTVVGIYPPTLFINISHDQRDVILNWEPPQGPLIHHYLIYRSTHQTDFDFNNVWVNTSIDKEPQESAPIPLRTLFNDTDAANPDNSTIYQEEYYYTIKAVNSIGKISGTSRTVGKWTRSFPKGVSTFSLPLEPLELADCTSDFLVNDMSARYVKWMDPTTCHWKKHGDGEVNNAPLEMGKGYEIAFDNATNYSFCGMPGAMIKHVDDMGFRGFHHNSEAKNISAIIMPNGDVNISWSEPGCMDVGDWYEVYNSTTRDGFFGNLGIDYFLACPPVNFGSSSATHSNAQVNDSGARMYYMIVPFDANGTKGASSYSMGIWTQEYNQGYDTLGIPLKLNESRNANWYCHYIPNIIGINYYNSNIQMWQWHCTRMSEGVFDPELRMTHGYQISTTSLINYTFIGI
jgi:PKD repeat protein